jgi:hypothetical protein
VTKRRTSWGVAALLGILAAGSLPAAEPSEAPRRREIREQARGLLAVRLKADVGLTDAQVGEVLPRIEAIEEGRRAALRSRRQLLAGLRRDVQSGASDASLQASLDALDRNEREQDQRTRDELARIDGALSVPQRVRLRFLLANVRGEIARQVGAIRENRRGVR